MGSKPNISLFGGFLILDYIQSNFCGSDKMSSGRHFRLHTMPCGGASSTASLDLPPKAGCHTMCECFFPWLTDPSLGNCEPFTSSPTVVPSSTLAT